MATPVNLHEYEPLARERLSQMAYDYYAGGANDEVTVGENVRSWERLKLRPRVLVDVSHVDTATTVLGQSLSMPVLTAPCGYNMLAHPDGECAVARATTAAGIIQVVSTVATKSLEEIAATGNGQRWFQLYCYRDREVSRSLIQRAEAAGYSALCVTVDVPFLGRREREIRDHFDLPAGMTMKNIERYAAGTLSASEGNSALAKYVSSRWDPGLTWESIDWMRSITRLPVVLKGILAGEDARLAVDHGVAGIIVSNHGGRQLDGVLTGSEALPDVVEAVAGRIEVFVDGGIRRGTDVVKALALGARAVLIGRPYLWGLAVNGEAGVSHVLELLRNEIVLAMALAGRPTVALLDKSLIAR